MQDRKLITRLNRMVCPLVDNLRDARRATISSLLADCADSRRLVKDRETDDLSGCGDRQAEAGFQFALNGYCPLDETRSVESRIQTKEDAAAAALRL